MLQELNDQFGLPGLLFSNGNGNLVRAVINTPVAAGEIYVHGAHVTQYQPRGHEPVLWMSGNSYFESGRPIRGGVPICFPWFGPNASNPQAPAHGLARTIFWDVVGSGRLADGGIAIEMATVIDGFSLRYRVEFGTALYLSLSVECGISNDRSHLASTPDTRDGDGRKSKLASQSYLGGSNQFAPHPPAPSPQKTWARGGNNSSVDETPRSFEEALHTYLAVGDIHQVSIEGLKSYDYLDKVGGVTKREASGEAIRFTQETDRVYLDTNTVCTLHDPVLKRRISVDQRNSQSTIVWNPWIDKSARMPDFGDDEWPGMVCIETANVGEQAIELKPGQQHTMVTRVEVHKTR